MEKKIQCRFVLMSDISGLMADLNLFKNVLNNSEILLLGPSLISFVFLMLNLLLHVLPLLSLILWLVSISL